MSIVFIKDSDPGWDKAMTLEEWVVSMFDQGKTDDPDFQAALRIYGRDRFVKLWKKYCEEKNVENQHAQGLTDAGSHIESGS